GPSYTWSTLSLFRERGQAATELFFVTGADAFVEIESWKHYPDLLDLAQFVVVSRPGWPVSELPTRLPRLAARMCPAGTEISARAPMIFLIDARTADVSSTIIRERRARGESISGLVDPAVEQHIERHGLYASSPEGGTHHEHFSSSTAGRLHGQS